MALCRHIGRVGSGAGQDGPGFDVVYAGERYGRNRRWGIGNCRDGGALLIGVAPAVDDGHGQAVVRGYGAEADHIGIACHRLGTVLHPVGRNRCVVLRRRAGHGHPEVRFCPDDLRSVARQRDRVGIHVLIGEAGERRIAVHDACGDGKLRIKGLAPIAVVAGNVVAGIKEAGVRLEAERVFVFALAGDVVLARDGLEHAGVVDALVGKVGVDIRQLAEQLRRLKALGQVLQRDVGHVLRAQQDVLHHLQNRGFPHVRQPYQHEGLLRLRDWDEEIPEDLPQQLDFRFLEDAAQKRHEARAFGLRIIFRLDLHGRVILRIVRAEGVVKDVIQAVLRVYDVRVRVDLSDRLADN